MRQLLPSPLDDIDPLDVYDSDDRRPPVGRPHLLVNMVSSWDGATVVSGVTAALGSAADKRIFFLLRSVADVILVGAQTVRAEGYGPARMSDAAAQRRVARGQPAAPAIAVVSRSLDLDWSSRFFTEAAARPIIIAPGSADPGKLRQASEVAEVVVSGHDGVDLPEALAALRRGGASVVLCEGGPTLNAELLQNGLLDELCLTMAPALVGAGGGATIMGAALLSQMRDLSLTHVLEEDGFLFLRGRVAAQAVEAEER